MSAWPPVSQSRSFFFVGKAFNETRGPDPGPGESRKDPQNRLVSRVRRDLSDALLVFSAQAGPGGRARLRESCNMSYGGSAGSLHYTGEYSQNYAAKNDLFL